MKYAVAVVAIAFLLVANLPREHDAGIDLGEDRTRLARLDGVSNQQRHDLLREWLTELGLDVENQPLSPSAGAPRADSPGNLVITVGEGDRDIVIGAHYDAIHSGGRISGGIVDNGAATLVLGRIAEELGRFHLRHRIRIVLFAREEIDQAGSRSYVSAFGERTVAMINMDVIGRGSTAIFGPTGNPANVILAESMQRSCAAGHHSCMNFARVPHSDDAVFSEAGVPVLSVGMLPRVEAHQLWLALHGGDGTGLGPGAFPRTLKIVNSMDDGAEEVSRKAMESAFCVLRDLVLLLDATLA